MILAVDIGNTNVSAGVYDGRVRVTRWKARRPRRADAAWWKEFAALACVGAGIAPEELEGAAISSVVPGAAGPASRALRRLTGRVPLVVDGGLPLGIAFAYGDPRRLGADRVCAIVAVAAKHPLPAIVVDCGTAITVDGIAPAGRGKGAARHVGGMILPGPAIATRALARSTAALPAVDRALPRSAAGRDTREGILAGAWFGTIGAVRECVGRLEEELVAASATGGRAETGGRAARGRSADRRSARGRGRAAKPFVVGTGGDASALMAAGRLFDAIDPDLVLDGAALAWKIARRRKRPARRRKRTVSSKRRAAKR